MTNGDVFHVEHITVVAREKGISMSKLQKAKSRLGRGLSSLISVSELPIENDVAAEPMGGETAATPPTDASSAPTPSVVDPAQIPVDQIAANPHQPRRSFDERTLADLAASLKTNGLIQ